MNANIKDSEQRIKAYLDRMMKEKGTVNHDVNASASANMAVFLDCPLFRLPRINLCIREVPEIS